MTDTDTFLHSPVTLTSPGRHAPEQVAAFARNPRPASAEYAPYAARFASADPFIPDALDPQSYNRYSYVNNNPLSFIDPSGFERREKDYGKAPGTTTIFPSILTHILTIQTPRPASVLSY